MGLQIGDQVWLPCEVKPGPFSDERLVRVQTENVEWLGFVPVFALKDSITQGNTFIRASIVEVAGDRFMAKLPGHPITTSLFQGLVSKVESLDPVQA